MKSVGVSKFTRSVRCIGFALPLTLVYCGTSLAENYLNRAECGFIREYNSRENWPSFVDQFLRIVHKDELCLGIENSTANVNSNDCESSLKKRAGAVELETILPPTIFDDVEKTEWFSVYKANMALASKISAQLAGIDVRGGSEAPEGGKMYVYISSSENSSELRANVLNTLMFDDVMHGSIPCASVSVSGPAGELLATESYINVNYGARQLAACTKVAVFHSLGLNGDPRGLADLFADPWNRQIVEHPFYDMYAEHEGIWLRLLYHPKMKVGFSQSETAEIVQEIFRDSCN